MTSSLSYFKNTALKGSSHIGLVWNLFADLGKQSKEEIISSSRSANPDRFNFSDILIQKAISGDIDLHQENFNIKGYDFSTQNFANLSRYKKLKKEVYLVNGIDKGGTDVEKDKYGEYSEDRLVSEDNDFDIIEQNMDYETAWSKFDSLSDMLETRGYSLCYLLLAVIDGYAQGIDNFRIVCEEIEGMRDWVESIFIPDRLEDIKTRLKEKAGG